MLNAGETAPDIELRTLSGEPVALATAWAESPVVLVFLRHFG